MNAEVLNVLDVRDGHDVLEIGCGPGDALALVSQRARASRVVGIDISELMADTARRRNRGADVRVGDVATLDFGDARFDRIFSVHSIYFWSDVDAVLANLARALKPGGKLVLAFRPEGDYIPARFRDPTYRFPRAEQVEDSLMRAGLSLERARVAVPHVMVLAAVRGGETRPEFDASSGDVRQ